MQKPPQNAGLPPIVEPRRFARQERILEGVIAAQRCERLSEISVHLEPLKVSLRFYLDESSRVRMTGQVATSLSLECQRCLEDMPVELEVAFDLAVLAYEDQASGLPSHMEWTLAEDDKLDLTALLEEEIILELPLVPMHDAGACEPPSGTEEGLSEPAVEEPSENPFKVLEQLKLTQDKP